MPTQHVSIILTLLKDSDVYVTLAINRVAAHVHFKKVCVPLGSLSFSMRLCGFCISADNNIVHLYWVSGVILVLIGLLLLGCFFYLRHKYLDSK